MDVCFWRIGADRSHLLERRESMQLEDQSRHSAALLCVACCRGYVQLSMMSQPGLCTELAYVPHGNMPLDAFHVSTELTPHRETG